MNLKIELMVCSSCVELVSVEKFYMTFHIESTWYANYRRENFHPAENDCRQQSVTDFGLS